jgi:hypothetical protein
MLEGIASESSLSQITKLLAVIIWPMTLLICVFTQRGRIGRILSALTVLAESANKIKIWQIEVEKSVENTIKQEVDKAAAQSQPGRTPDIPKNVTLASARVETLIASAPTTQARENLTESVRQRMLELAENYDRIRANMPPSHRRTVAMDAELAAMRILALSAKPFLREFAMNERSAGLRLAAIAILQVSPDRSYIAWLRGRFDQEAPFIFFQASVALLQAVRDIGSDNRESLRHTITHAMNKIESYKEGIPDQGTLSVLNTCLKELDSLRMDSKGA